jgi:hypothetical protein
MLQKFAEVSLVEFFERRELPKQGPKFVAKLGHTGIKEALDGVAGFRQHPPVDRITHALDRKDEVIRHLACP